MILQALERLAQSENLLAGEPDYEFRRVAWGISLSATGKFQKLLSYRIDRNAGNDRKENFVGKWSLVPKQPIRTSGAKSFFLIDKCEYILGLDPTGNRKKKDLAERAGLFREKVQAWFDETGDKVAKTLIKFLSEIDMHHAAIQKDKSFAEIEPNDLMGFMIKANWVHREDTAKKYWSVLRSTTDEENGSGESYQCLVTGQEIEDIPLFPLLKRVPGGTSSGVALVSHNASAFCSFGMDGNENAPVSREASEACGVALARLLDPQFPNPNGKENWDAHLEPRHIRLGSSTAVCFWTREQNSESEQTLNSLAQLLHSEDESSVAKNLKSIWYGQPARLKKPNEFYALTISGTQGRAIIRDWLETSLDDVNENLARHFADLAICRNTQPKSGTAETPAVPMNWLLKSLAAEGRSDPVPPTVESGFVRAALRGMPYPLQMLQRALVRSRAEAGGDEWVDSMRRDARAAILKAVLNRRLEKKLNFTDYPEVMIDMNPESRNTGYTLGMLMAVLEQLQRLALDDVNASVVDRYFSAASASPKSVFVRLLKNSVHHYRKARQSEKELNRKSARYMERVKDEILSWLRIESDDVEGNLDESAKPKRPKPYPLNITSQFGIPASLSLEDQGLFVLGYHQMRHWIFMKKEVRIEWEKQYPNAPAIFLRKKQEEVEKEETESVPA